MLDKIIVNNSLLLTQACLEEVDNQNVTINF